MIDEKELPPAKHYLDLEMPDELPQDALHLLGRAPYVTCPLCSFQTGHSYGCLLGNVAKDLPGTPDSQRAIDKEIEQLGLSYVLRELVEAVAILALQQAGYTTSLSNEDEEKVRKER